MPDMMRPLTVDQVVMLGRPSLVGNAAILERRTLSSLDVERPPSMVSVVLQYLERFHPRGQFASYRR
jgi:NADH dehydrogenase